MRNIWRKPLAYLLITIMWFNVISVPTYAQGNDVTEILTEVVTEDVYESESYKVTFTLTSYWDTGYNANVKVENIGDNPIQNWYLCFDYDSSIISIWNAEVYSNEDNRYIIKNAGWNQNINVGESIEFGISGDQAFKAFPKNYEFIGASIGVSEEAYTVQYNLDSDWGNGFSSSIYLTNNTSTTLEDWVLEFNFDREITEIWNGIIESHEGNHYVIKNVGHNGNILPGQNVIIGFNGIQGSVEKIPYNYYLESYTLNNGEPSEPDKDNDSDVEIDSSGDLDGDGLTNEEEAFWGTDSDKVDSDGDGLNDYIECYILYTDPTKEDTDEDGVIDSLEDLDSDGLTNAEELVYGTDSSKVDTDGDDLNDYEEVITYKSNPLKEDTDGDGLNDYDDIVLGFSPLKQDTDENGLLDPDEKVGQVLEKTFRSEEGRGITQVAVSMTLSGNIERNVGITNVYEFDSMSRGVVGLVGIPVDITSKEDFDSATIIFTYDEALLGTTKEENLAVLWYDEENVWYQIMDCESVVDTVNNTVSYTTNHFSTYMLVDREAWFNAWNEEIVYDMIETSEDYANYDFLICMDEHVSMEDFEKEREIARKIVELMTEDDRASFCYYSIQESSVCYFSYGKEDALNQVNAQGYPYLEERIGIYNDADFWSIGLIDEHFKEHSNGKNIAFIINTGKNDSANYTSWYNQAELCLSQMDYPIYAISINDDVNEKFDDLLEKYGQQSWNIEEALDNIQNIPSYTRISDTDNDEDGLYDTYEINGIKMPNGRTFYLKTNTRDTDEDGLTDFEETAMICREKHYIGFLKIKEITYTKMYSDPTNPDTDGDDILDSVDDNPRLANEVVIELDDNYGFQYLNIVDENGCFTDAGDQDWWEAKTINKTKNLSNFITDINSRIWHVGCGVIAMTDLEIYLAQKNGYRFTYPWPSFEFSDTTNAPVYDYDTGCMDREEYMSYVEYNSLYKYRLKEIYHFYKGVDSWDMENGMREFLKHNNVYRNVSWAPYMLQCTTNERIAVVEQMEFMLSNNIPVVFSYHTSDENNKLPLYFSVEGAKSKDQGNVYSTAKSHYMTVIGLRKYLNEEGTGYDYVLKVTSGGGIYYINYQVYSKNLSYASNILSIGKESE